MQRHVAAVLRVPTLAPAKVLVMATLIGQLPVWIGATLATWAVCWTLVSPEACQDSPACAKHLKTYPGDTTLFHVFSCFLMFSHVLLFSRSGHMSFNTFEHVEVLCGGGNSCVCGRGYYHIVSTAALLAMAGHEVCGLIATYLGSQQTQALIPHLKSRCLSLSCKFSQH